MAFNITIHDSIFNWDIEILEKRLLDAATSTKPQMFWKVSEDCEITPQKALNQLQAQVLATDDRNLISLFRRAVRNHDSIHPNEQAEPVPLFNKHYMKPPFLIPHTNVTLDVHEQEVIVTTALQIARTKNQSSITLDAHHHNVSEIYINGQTLPEAHYHVTQHEIIILNIPQEESFEVKIISSIDPFNNKTLEGLYKSGDWLATQCESEGARRIFPTLDRPDVLSRYTTTIIANAEQYPYRLSNGNLVSEETDESGRTAIKWDDPFPKPSYLFAVVMGDFGVIKDTFITRSGREVTIEVYMKKGKEQRAEFSLFALKRAMMFEEEYFDREYDLESLKMVALPDFNAGAMENKGLIIFNESCILVDPTCASDLDYYWVAHVVSHEYCHNWSGNRVTVRNWFELALKEAFTDFRCSQFMEWLFGDEMVRPYEATTIREKQFPQDASLAAHPIQVDSYINVGEIYDDTTYIKGREVFRMLKTLLDSHSNDGFRKAQNVYFDRYDGQAVSFRELLSTLQQVSGVNLVQFERWFHQPGTPSVHAEMQYDSAKKVAKVYFRQSCPHPKTRLSQEPFYIPMNVELLDQEGKVLVPRQLITLTEREQVYEFKDLEKCPIPVFHHDFCAPVKMDYNYSDTQLAIILSNEQDAYARKEAGEVYLKRILRDAYQKVKASGQITLPNELTALFSHVLSSQEMTPLAKAELLDLPSIRSIVEKDKTYNFTAARKARTIVFEKLACELESQFLETLDSVSESRIYDPEHIHFKDEMAIRCLRNTCYSYLSLVPGNKYNDLIFKAYEKATNFNNQFALLGIIVDIEDPRQTKVLNDFFETWKDDSTILCNWIETQTGASSCSIEVLNNIHNTEGFLKENPDHMRSLIQRFVNNLAAYHADPRQTYKYVTDRILEYGELNPSVASFSLAEEAFKDYAKLPENLKTLMREQLERLAMPNVCKEIRAVAQKYL